MTYNNIYAAISKVKPCRTYAKHGMVGFDLIEEEGENLRQQMIDSIRSLNTGKDFFYGSTLQYKFGDKIQRRTWFRISK